MRRFVVKDGALTYQPDKRAMVKVKHQRTADCVVAGFRTHKDGAGVGSLLLGLFDRSGTLHHVGVASGFSVARRRELEAALQQREGFRFRCAVVGSRQLTEARTAIATGSAIRD